MSEVPFQQLLKSVALFQTLPDEAFGIMQKQMRITRARAGYEFIQHNMDTDSVYFIIDGAIRVLLYSPDGKKIAIRDLQAGQYFGELSAIDQRPRSATVAALSDCVIAEMSGPQFMQLMHRYPCVMEALLGDLVANIRHMTDRVFELQALSVGSRVCAELLRLASAVNAEGGVIRISPFPTHAEIAEQVGTTREAVTRELNDLAREGVLVQERRVATIANIEKLVAFVDKSIGFSAQSFFASRSETST